MKRFLKTFLVAAILAVAVSVMTTNAGTSRSCRSAYGKATSSPATSAPTTQKPTRCCLAVGGMLEKMYGFRNMTPPRRGWHILCAVPQRHLNESDC